MSSFIGVTQQFEKEVSELIKSMENAILSGIIINFEEYKRLTGKRDGLFQALEIYKNLIAQMENYDDDRANR